MKLLKVLAYVVGGIVVLAILALGVAAWVVDGAFVKARLEQAMKERKRTLVIEGEPKVRIFPVAGITMGKLTLTEPSSDKVFVALEAAARFPSQHRARPRDVGVTHRNIAGTSRDHLDGNRPPARRLDDLVASRAERDPAQHPHPRVVIDHQHPHLSPLVLVSPNVGERGRSAYGAVGSCPGSPIRATGARRDGRQLGSRPMQAGW